MISLVSLFLEGLLSFLSPCVLPLIPLYMSYLSVDAKMVDSEGNTHYDVRKVFLMTVFFVLGISCTFLLLAYSVNSISQLFERYKDIIAIISGTLIIIFGLHETGILTISVLDQQHSLPFDLINGRMSVFKAFMMGFVFSFAWTPCIGPMLTSAILAASSGKYGLLYLGVYAAGLIIPFLITGLLTSKVLDLIEKKRSIIRYTMVLAGVILILFGGNMIKDASRNILAKGEAAAVSNEQSLKTVYTDVYGQKIDLNDYKEKYVFLNFITSWCTYCRQELPEYSRFSEFENVECLFVMSDDYNGQSMSSLEYVKENGIELPVIDDKDNYLFSRFGVNSFPICFILGPDGTVIGYSSGYKDHDGFMDVYNGAVEIFEQNSK